MLIYLDVKITGEPRRVNGSSRACAQWRAERPDLDASSMVVMGRLQEAALVIARDRLNPLFARYGMQPGEFDVLATLRRGGAPFALTPAALARRADDVVGRDDRAHRPVAEGRVGGAPAEPGRRAARSSR